jgi:glycosyltransferase involved in cell wall biosynthesis
MRVSIILPCRNEAAYIAECLDSILATRWPHQALEILVVDGASDDGTRDIIAGYARRFPVIRLLDNPSRIVPTALNIGIRAASGDVIVRMDAHVVYPPEYVPRLVAALEETRADNVGACIVTHPADDSPTARAIATALSHPFGVGNSWFRIGAGERRWVDTVPFGCYRRHVFSRVGLFDEDLVRNQDDEFNHRLIRHGGRILLVPDVVSHYYARGSFRQLARMYYQYGLFKPLAARKIGRIMTVRQLIPAMLVLALFGLPLLAPFAAPARTLWQLAAGSYALALALCAARQAKEIGWPAAARVLIAFPELHLSYGAGFLRGLWAATIGHDAARPQLAQVPLSR